MKKKQANKQTSKTNKKSNKNNQTPACTKVVKIKELSHARTHYCQNRNPNRVIQ